MKPSLIASILLASASLTACATDDSAPGEEMDIEITSVGGKSDAIDGKRLRVRTGFSVSPWFKSGDAQFDELADLTKVKEVSVDVATNDAVVVSGTSFLFTGTAGAAVEDSPWYGEKIFKLSVEAALGAKTASSLGFILFDASAETAKIIKCTRGAQSTNFFHSVAIDLTARELHADSTLTFTFAECGLGSAAKTTWDFGAFVVPLETTGSLEGKFNYKMKADLI